MCGGEGSACKGCGGVCGGCGRDEIGERVGIWWGVVCNEVAVWMEVAVTLCGGVAVGLVFVRISLKMKTLYSYFLTASQPKQILLKKAKLQ